MGIIYFTKMNGAGNDFVLIDAIKNPGLELSSSLIRKICHRRKGIGADGILFIKPSEINDFCLEYYNSDGSLGSLCGNGARCSIQYVVSTFATVKDKTNFSCNSNLYSGNKNSDDSITFNLLEPETPQVNINVKIDGANINCNFIDTGSPHVIIFWKEIQHLFDLSYSKFNMTEFGKKIRFANEFQPEGTNVNIINEEDGKRFIRTYERGVEDETLACGTGTVAASLITNIIDNISSPIAFFTFDKDELTVNFKKKNDKFTKISLTGPAKINYIGSYNF